MKEIDDRFKERLRKLRTLAERGATEGEKEAARRGIDRILNRFGIDPDKFNEAVSKEYEFKYQTAEERTLFFSLQSWFCEGEDKERDVFRYSGTRTLIVRLEYENYIVLSCAYEYFRRHMKAQWAKTLERARPTLIYKRGKAKRELIAFLKRRFISEYIIASKLIDESKLKTMTGEGLTPEQKQAMYAASKVEGGQYHTQLTSEERMIGTGQPEPTQPSKPQLKLF